MYNITQLLRISALSEMRKKKKERIDEDYDYEIV